MVNKVDGYKGKGNGAGPKVKKVQGAQCILSVRSKLCLESLCVDKLWA